MTPNVSGLERKLMVALTVTALAPTIGALLLGGAIVSETYETGVNADTLSDLESAVDAHEAHLVTIRELGEAELRYAMSDPELSRATTNRDESTISDRLAALNAATPHLRALELEGPRGVMSRAGRPQDGDVRLAFENHSETGVQLIGWLARPAEIETARTRSAERAAVYARLEEDSPYVRQAYLWIYVGWLAFFMLLALGIGFWMSRRVTRRVTSLAKATQRVGAGDLTVTLPTGSYDEVHELTHAFNAMVRDLRDSRQRVEYLQRIGAWQEFARRLAHEIKNPLTPIQLAAQEVYRSYPGDDKRFQRRLQDAKEIIEEEVETLRRLVSEFSEFARLPIAELSEQRLGSLVEEMQRLEAGLIADLFSEAGEAPSLHIEASEAARAAELRIDTAMLKRALVNLVRNGLQAIRDANGSFVRLRFSIREGAPPEERYGIEIMDDGPGIPESKRARVFDPYFTTKSDGTGLGLPIVKKIALEHGGDIRLLESERGAHFLLTLPMKEHAPRGRLRSVD